MDNPLALINPLTALVAGFATSLHCVGMCGPLVLALPGGQTRQRFVVGRLLYSAGRLTTYAVLGGLFGLLGGAVHLAGWQQAVSILLGALLLATAAVWFGMPLLRRHLLEPTALLSRAVGLLKAHLGRLFGSQSLKALFGIGLLNGLLPCGFVYLALAASLTAAGPLQGAAYMALFGAGTVPAIELTFRIRPPPCSRIIGVTSPMSCSAPNRFTSKVRRTWSRESCSSAAPRL